MSTQMKAAIFIEPGRIDGEQTMWDHYAFWEQAVELKLSAEALPEIAAKLDALAAAAGGELARQQASVGAITTHRRVHVRYEGSDSALVVGWPEPGAGASSPVELLAAITAGFEAAYRQRFAFLMQGKGLVVEAVSVEAVVAGDPGVFAPDAPADAGAPQPG